MKNRKAFYQMYRQRFENYISQPFVEGCEVILDRFEVHKETLNLTDQHLAYILATAYHETDKKMQPIVEYGLGKNRTYGKVDHETGKTYYGRGFVQLTWRENYEKMGEILGIDLVHEPELLISDPVISADVMIVGMAEGIFTEKKLSNFINDKLLDYYNARRIVNHLDKASVIASYARKFEACVKAGNTEASNV